MDSFRNEILLTKSIRNVVIHDTIGPSPIKVFDQSPDVGRLIHRLRSIMCVMNEKTIERPHLFWSGQDVSFEKVAAWIFFS
jgi:hypothetical protein